MHAKDQLNLDPNPASEGTWRNLDARRYGGRKDPARWGGRGVQPIFKGGKKESYCPSSYRAIFLIRALAKLFLITRLSVLTEAHNTLTDNQIGTASESR